MITVMSDRVGQRATLPTRGLERHRARREQDKKKGETDAELARQTKLVDAHDLIARGMLP